MEYLSFDIEKSMEYHWCGKFVSPNADWTHMTRGLWDFELILVTEGSLGIADHENTYEVGPGEFLLMSPTPFQHGIKSGDCSFYWMHFSYHQDANDPLISTNLSDAKQLALPRTGTIPALDRIIILIKQLMDSDRRYKSQSLNNALCTAVLGELSAQCSTQATTKPLTKEQLLEDIKNYISWHCGDNLRISQIAEYFGYNEKYLTTLFKSQAGISLKQYYLQTKMERAKTALSETNQTIASIAYGLGFSDIHNFSNAFKKITELSPTEYRESYSKHNVFQV